jgi:hypothetical protein
MLKAMSSSPDAKDPAMEPGRGHGSARDVTVAEAEARYHAERLALYKARALTGKPTSPGRLRELERNAERAGERARQLRGR